LEHKSKMPPKGTGRPDNFQTLNPEVAVQPILDGIPKDKVIWCPASGEGRMVKYMREQGYTVISSDILQGWDFLDTMSELPEFDCIIENPPYATKDKWLQRCYDLGKPFALMLPATAIGEQGRVKMYNKYGVDIFLPNARIEFITPNGTEGGGWFYAAWFCKGIKFPKWNEIGRIYGGG